jgi:hypothetical protein
LILGKFPKVVGSYRIGSEGLYYRINFSEKPALWHRLMMRMFFGMVWEDEE